MKEAPVVRYAKSRDGVGIAYGIFGEGAPLLYCRPPIAPPFPTIATCPAFDPWFGELALHHRLIMFDFRNGGLSGRGSAPLDSDRFSLDMLAIFDDLRLQEADIFVELFGCPAAIRFVAEHRKRVRRLLLWHPMTGNAMETVSPEQTERWRSTFEFARSDWDIFTVRILSESFDLPGNDVRSISEAWRRTTKAADFVEAWNPWSQDDISALLPNWTTPTLALQRMEDGYCQTLQDGIRIASQIPDARLAPIPGMTNFSYTENVEAIISEIESFLGQGPAIALQHARQSAFRTILFTDVVSSTPLLAQLRDAKMREVMRDHDEVLAAAVTGHGGRVIKTIGDAFMAEFAVPSAGIEAAIAAQRGIRERFAESDVPIRIRIGINAGEPIEEDGDLHGPSVVVAKRLESAAGDSGILVSDVVKQMVTGKDFDFGDRGPVQLKGVEEPVHAWAVRW